MTTPYPPGQPPQDQPQGQGDDVPKPGQQPQYQHPEYPQPGYAPPGYPAPGYSAPGAPQQGAYGHPGYGYAPQQGYTPPSYPQQGYAPPTGAYGMPVYPGGGYPQPGYGGIPSSPKPVVPSSVSGAFLLWMAVLVVGILANIVLFAGGYYDRVQQAIEQLNLSSAQSDLVTQASRSILIVGAVIGLAISVFIYVFFGLKMRAGRNWSRIVLTVLGGLSVLFGAAGNAATSMSGVDVLRPAGSVILAWIGVILAAVAIIAMYLPASNTYFRESKSYRSAPR